VRLSGLA